MKSTTKLILTLKIYFLPGCFACQLAQRHKIKRLLKKSLILKINIQYSTDCISDPISIGLTPISLDNDVHSGESDGDNNRLAQPERSKRHSTMEK